MSSITWCNNPPPLQLTIRGCVVYFKKEVGGGSLAGGESGKRTGK